MHVVQMAYGCLLCQQYAHVQHSGLDVHRMNVHQLLFALVASSSNSLVSCVSSATDQFARLSVMGGLFFSHFDCQFICKPLKH